MTTCPSSTSDHDAHCDPAMIPPLSLYPAPMVPMTLWDLQKRAFTSGVAKEMHSQPFLKANGLTSRRLRLDQDHGGRREQIMTASPSARLLELLSETSRTTDLLDVMMDDKTDWTPFVACSHRHYTSRSLFLLFASSFLFTYYARIVLRLFSPFFDCILYPITVSKPFGSGRTQHCLCRNCLARFVRTTLLTTDPRMIDLIEALRSNIDNGEEAHISIVTRKQAHSREVAIRRDFQPTCVPLTWWSPRPMATQNQREVPIAHSHRNLFLKE